MLKFLKGHYNEEELAALEYALEHAGLQLCCTHNHEYFGDVTYAVCERCKVKKVCRDLSNCRDYILDIYETEKNR